MKLAELVKISSAGMKVMSENDIKMSDWKYVPMFDEYQRMKRKGEKYRYVMAVLSDRYGMSESTVKRALSRLSAEVKL